jgi:hypothetical protein
LGRKGTASVLVATAKAAAPRVSVTWSKRRASRLASPRARGRDASYNESSQASQVQEVRFITGRPELWSRGGHSHLRPMWPSASWVGAVAVVLASEKYTQLLTGPC